MFRISSMRKTPRDFGGRSVNIVEPGAVKLVIISARDEPVV